MPSTPVRPKPNRIFIRSVAHLHAAKIMASLDRSLAPPSLQQHAIEATQTRTTPTSLPREHASSHRLQHKRRTAASAERCKDQNHHDGLRPHQGTANRSGLTRTSNHSPAPTTSRPHRAPHTAAAERPLPARTLPSRASQCRRLHGCAHAAATDGAGAPPTPTSLLHPTPGSRRSPPAHTPLRAPPPRRCFTGNSTGRCHCPLPPPPDMAATGAWTRHAARSSAGRDPI